jgi:glycosyltransferase involved in cell wall biosynthesis
MILFESASEGYEPFCKFVAVELCVRICLISENEISRQHGTGTQMMLLFEGHVNYTHFFWYPDRGSEIVNSYQLSDGRLPIPKIGAALLPVQEMLGLTWWCRKRVNRNRFSQWLKDHHAEFDVAYVVVASEDNARRANSMIDLLDCPYVLHVMDLYEAAPHDPEKMPEFHRLVESAASVIALTPTIREQMTRLAPGKFIHEIAIGQPVTSHVARPPGADTPVRIAMVGRPYHAGEKALAHAWPAISQIFPGLELVYYGPHFRKLDPAIQAIAGEGGFFSSAQDEEYRKALASAHLAFLSGPGELDCFGLYSFPSRCVDYLMAGLPILGCVAKGSATEKMLEPLIPQSVRLAITPQDMVDAITDLLSTDQRWQLASRGARSFAMEHFSIDRVRAQVSDLLAAAKRNDNQTSGQQALLNRT